jgi:phenylpropionate dioxygenase-like ring-hydroxylating dioxygenase large terminal subunit
MYPFKDGCYAPRNGWYVAAFNHEVKRELLSRWILNEPVVLYRTEAGEPVALDGRCPHRHFPLGKSCLIGDEIQCLYHGITFGPDGKCTRVPSQTHVPQTYKVKKYPVVEHGLWLFIWPGDPELADPALLPDLEPSGWSDPEFRFQPFYSLEVEGRYQLLNDNLLDLTHLAFLHGTSIGVAGNAEAPEEREELAHVLKSRRNMRNVPIMATQRGRFDYDGPVDRLAGMDFYLPGFHAGLDEMRIPEDHPTRGGERLTCHRVFHAVTPAKLDSCNYFFGMGGIMTDEEFDATREHLWPVIEEDAMATREIEAMLSTLGYYPDELMLKSDTGAVRGRRRLQAMMDAEQQAAR